MINRLVIRTRVLQTAYAYMHKEEQKLTAAEADLKTALGRTYDLYLFLLRLPIDLTDFWGQLIELRKNKHLASSVERNPNYRPLNNAYIAKLEECQELDNWYNQFPLAWSDESSLLRNLINEIESSDIYRNYLTSSIDFENDRNFWVNIFHQIIAPNPQLAHYLEEQSLYWDDNHDYIEKIACEEYPKSDPELISEAVALAKANNSYQSLKYENGSVEVVKNFVLKTMKKSEAELDFAETLLPQYKDSDDITYAQHLLRQTILGYQQVEEILRKHISVRWEKDRLASMDELIMHLAITEFLHFPNIPTNITINEYVELSKHYSTPKSSSFVNGVLDAVAKELKAEGKIIK